MAKMGPADLDVAVVAFGLAGSVNPALLAQGKRTNIGFDPASASANISWTDGLNISDRGKIPAFP